MPKDPGPRVSKNIHAGMSGDDWHPNRKSAEASAKFARKRGEFAFIEEKPFAKTPFGQFRRNKWQLRTRRPTAVKVGKTWRAVIVGGWGSKRGEKFRRFWKDEVRRGHLVWHQIRGKWWLVTSGRGARDPKTLPKHIRSNHMSFIPAALRKVGMGRKKRRKR